MKKIISIVFLIALLALTVLSVSAATGGFVLSPSNNNAPVLIEGKNESKDCTSKVVITSYGDRDRLSQKSRKDIEAAYTQIIGTLDLATLTDEVEDVAKKLEVSTSKLSVVDLFDISNTDCEGHDAHGKFTITIKPTTLKNFACLLHYSDGEWEVVDSAKLTNNGEHIQFTAKELSPYAIVLYEKEIVEPVEKIDLGILIASIAAGANVVGGAAFFVYKYRKIKL